MTENGFQFSPIWIKRLEDLRKRLIIMAISIVGAAILCFVFVDYLRYILVMPAGNPELIYIAPAEALMANIRLAIATGFLLVLPIIFYQIIALIWPMLPREKKKATIFLPLGMIILFALGLFFAYEVVFPIALDFFQEFQDEGLEAMFTLQNYLSFSLGFLFAFGVVFQLPLIFWFLGVLGLVNPPLLRKNRKFAILIMLVLSSIITPPDLFSQLLMIGPLLGLYELGILMVVISHRRKRKAQLRESE